MPKKTPAPPPPPDCTDRSLGLSPAVFKGRDVSHKKETWCPDILPLNMTMDYDFWCDPKSPRSVTYKDIVRADTFIRTKIMKSPLYKSKTQGLFDLNIYFKLETVHRTGSFHERSALYALEMLNFQERENGVLTASLGNWAMALAYIGRKMHVKVTVVLPVHTPIITVKKCQLDKATVLLHGNNLMESRLEAFRLIKVRGVGTYINGYDHPNVIAGAGTVGLEIMEQLPSVDAILVPVGGGGLLAGISEAVKNLKPSTLIYGVETFESCSFFKALDNCQPYAIENNIAAPLAVPTAGYNAFHTARSLVDKMVLVRNDWINRAMLRLAEEERLVVEHAGAVGLAALLAVPYLVPELQDKTVVCVLSGGNTDNFVLPRALEYGMAVEGRIVSMKIKLPAFDKIEENKLLKIISNIGCNIIHYESDCVWITEADLFSFYATITCETRSLRHTFTLKRVLDKLFPEMCEFSDEPYCEKYTCPCQPKLWPPL